VKADAKREGKKKQRFQDSGDRLSRGIDNFILTIEMYNHDSSTRVIN